MMMFFSPFLALNSSYWPLLVSMILFSVVSFFLLWMNMKMSLGFVLFFVFILLLTVFMWWRDVMRESMIGYHTSKLEFSFRSGMILFISSEVLFFVSFFWAFFDSSLSPSIEFGMMWPPLGILPLSVYSVPLLNTIILLSSGVSVTWSHHSLLNNKFNSSVVSLFLTLFLGVYFLYMQYVEYMESAFSISDGSYGSTFFMATGFHGMHVMVGSSMLFYTLIMMLFCKLIYNHHFVFEASAWYWHFVDVVWLFLYISIYWWGSL